VLGDVIMYLLHIYDMLPSNSRMMVGAINVVVVPGEVVVVGMVGIRHRRAPVQV
jgi:hypothetical protein